MLRLAGGVGVESGDGVALSGIIERYLAEQRRLHRFSAQTSRNVRCALHGFARVYGKRPLAQLSPRHVERWLGTMEHLSTSTRRQRLSYLRGYLGWLQRRKLVPRNVALEVEPPKQPRSVPRALRADAVGRLLDACPDTRGILIVTLMVQQGLRCCEVSRLELGDFSDGAVRVIGKGGHHRILPIVEETERALLAHLGEWPASAGPLIRSYKRPSRPLAPDSISRLVAGWMRDAGLKGLPRDGISAHALRHTAATDMLRAGAHLRDVQHALGHAHLTTTEVYLPHIVHGLRQAMEGRSYRPAVPIEGEGAA